MAKYEGPRLQKILKILLDHITYIQNFAWEAGVLLEMGKFFSREPFLFFKIFRLEKFLDFCTEKLQKHTVSAS